MAEDEGSGLAVVLEQVGKPKRGKLKQLGSLTGVKHVDDINPEVALKPKNVSVSTVEDLDNVGVGKDLIE